MSHIMNLGIILRLFVEHTSSAAKEGNPLLVKEKRKEARFLLNMEGLTRDCSESFESDLSSDHDPKSPHGYLCFFSKISDDLRVHFSRNSGKEDYCEDIYEDIYSTPVSGSYSYYKDLVDVAQKADTRNDNQKRTRFEFHEQTAPTFSE
ncbi:hypothetical protein AVEN_169683-1 [Araneus ventricosus]|uniref:Uncharacterized protein n=1 Tax=Araneus ventricosus TaxID=182803 RepID=A0A4Y2D141_ARAVE|nr:hypothetical protein AVEN_169683-1 [Araneus ventricosus]